ncbi:MAG: hypothetical protein AAF327_03445 [Cyanobacteria bacterium P01_A01_bin.37]
MARKSFTIFPFDGSPAGVLVLLEDMGVGTVHVTLSVDPSENLGNIVGFFTDLNGITVDNNFSITSVDTDGDRPMVGEPSGISTLFLGDSGSTIDSHADETSGINPNFDLAVQFGSGIHHHSADEQRMVFQLLGPPDFDSSDIEKVGVELKRAASDGKGSSRQFLEADVYPGAYSDALVSQSQRSVPDVSVRKQADVTSIDNVGDVIHYTIDVENTGDQTLTNINVSDPLIPDLVLSSGDADQDGELDVGETFRFTGSFIVTQDIINASIAEALSDSSLAASSDTNLTLSNFSHSPLSAEAEAIADTFTSAEVFGAAAAVAEAEATLTSTDVSTIATADASSQFETDGAAPLEDVTKSPDNKTTGTGKQSQNQSKDDESETDVLASNEVSNQTMAKGVTALGIAESEASIVSEFEIGAGETFSFDFEGQLTIVTDVDAPIFGSASAGGEIFLGIFDTEGSPTSEPLEFLSISSQVLSSESDSDEEFLDIQNSEAVKLDANETDILTDFEGATQSVDVDVSGSFEKTFESDTVLTLVEVKNGGAVSDADLQGGAPILNTVTVTTDQTDAVSAEASVEVDIAPEIAIDIQKLTNGVDADTAQEAVELNPGEEIVWTYQVSNLGNVSLENVVVVDDNGTPDDISDDFTPTFVEGDANQNSLLDPDEMWIFTATGFAKDLSVSINFDIDGDGNPLAAGEVIEDQFASLGVTVATPENAFGAMIFDSANPTGGDVDLGTPSQPTGPGVGKDSGAGIGNILPQGNVLIISEDGDASDADDNATGGTLQFDFDDLVRVTGVNLLDIDLVEETVTVETFDDGQLVQSYQAQNLGDNSFQELALGGELVDQLDVNLVRSGAVTEVNFTTIFENVSHVSAQFSNVIVESSESSHYTNSFDPLLT